MPGFFFAQHFINELQREKTEGMGRSCEPWI